LMSTLSDELTEEDAVQALMSGGQRGS
jgi:hypothetical protein